MRLIDGDVGVGRRAGIRIGDGDPSELPPANFMRRLARGPSWVVERVVFVAVAVRPTVDRDRLDVARRIEPALAEDARELIADVAFEGRERRLQQLHPASLVLLTRR